MLLRLQLAQQRSFEHAQGEPTIHRGPLQQHGGIRCCQRQAHADAVGIKPSCKRARAHKHRESAARCGNAASAPRTTCAATASRKLSRSNTAVPKLRLTQVSCSGCSLSKARQLIPPSCCRRRPTTPQPWRIKAESACARSRAVAKPRKRHQRAKRRPTPEILNGHLRQAIRQLGLQQQIANARAGGIRLAKRLANLARPSRGHAKGNGQAQLPTLPPAALQPND